jgi:mannose-1-phosphate guanylyltransferase
MKAFLLAAGKGTRLKPLTERIPKCLVPIRGRPLLRIWLEHLNHHGVKEVLINTHHHATQVERFVRGFNGKPRIRIEYEPVLLGSGGTIWYNRDFVQGDQEFWVIYADNLSSVNLKEMFTYHQEHKGLLTIGLFRTENPTECGIALLDKAECVVEFEEKPARPKSNLANAGIYLVRKEIFQDVLWDFPMPLDFGYHILPQLAGKMYGHVINDYHLDIGTLENFDRAQKEYND